MMCFGPTLTEITDKNGGSFAGADGLGAGRSGKR
jgi:hypothetical protein